MIPESTIQEIVIRYGLKQAWYEAAAPVPGAPAHVHAECQNRQAVLRAHIEILREKLERAGALGLNGCVALKWTRCYEIGLQEGRKGIQV